MHGSRQEFRGCSGSVRGEYPRAAAWQDGQRDADHRAPLRRPARLPAAAPGQGPRALRLRRRPAADGRHRPDLGVRLRPGQHHPGQGRGAHPAVAVVVRPAHRHRRQPRALHRRARAGARPSGHLRAAGDDPGGVRGPRLPDGLRLAGVPAVRSVCGVPLPAGLHDGSRLDQPIFTPATKAALGEHDENVSYEVVVDTVGAEVGRAHPGADPGRLPPRGGDRPGPGDRAGRHQARVRPTTGRHRSCSPTRS